MVSLRLIIMVDDNICENCGESEEDYNELLYCEKCGNQICDLYSKTCKKCRKYLCDACYSDHKKECKK